MSGYFLPDDGATKAAGEIIAQHLQASDVVTLFGDLGAGKSAISRAIVRAYCDDPEMDVPSPTFAIVQPYDGISHCDLYRLSDESELDALGLFDNPDEILLVEWPDRAPMLLERDGIRISLSIPKTYVGREMIIEAQGARNIDALLQDLAVFKAL